MFVALQTWEQTRNCLNMTGKTCAFSVPSVGINMFAGCGWTAMLGEYAGYTCRLLWVMHLVFYSGVLTDR